MFKKLKETLTGTKSTEATETETKTAEAGIPPAKKAGDMELTEEQQNSAMGKLMAATPKNPPGIGDLVEGPVIALDKATVYVDLAPYGSGIIYGREYIVARDVIKAEDILDYTVKPNFAEAFAQKFGASLAAGATSMLTRFSLH